MPGGYTAGGDRHFLLFKETIDRAAEGEVKYIRHLGGKNEYGHVKIRLTPFDRGSGVSLLPINATFSPAEYFPGVEQGLMGAVATGPAGRYEVTDLQAEVIDGSYHEVDSCIRAFAEATEEAVRKALQAAEP